MIDIKDLTGDNFEEYQNQPHIKILQQRADTLTENDADYVQDLINIRKARGLTIEEVAKRCSWAVETAQEFEKYYNEPKLIQLRMYAHAVGAIVKHSVSIDPNDPLPDSNTAKKAE